MRTFEVIHTVEKLVKDVAGVKKGDKVLVVTDAFQDLLGDAYTLVCRGIGAETVLAIMPITETHGNEPPDMITAAMKAADVCLVATTHSLSHTKARLEASATGTRIYMTRGLTEDMLMKGAVTVDFKALRERTTKVAEVLTAANEVRVQSLAGTDVTFKLTGRKGIPFCGVWSKETGFASFITGEAASGPLEGTTNGTIVVDFSMDSIGLLKQPLVFTVKDGKVVNLTGASEEVNAIQRYLDRNENNRNIAEFAIGTNPKARLIGILQEDKKKEGSVHFAIGDNKSLGGIVEAEIHLDGLLLKPTVTIDNKTVLVDNGKLLL
jgi:leucyl aminopeptidase (aminopeptidase T)